MFDTLSKGFAGFLVLIVFLMSPFSSVKGQQYLDQFELGLAVQHDFSVMPFQPQTSLVPEVLFSGWIVQLGDHAHLRWSIYGNYRDENISLGTIYDTTNEVVDFRSATAGGRIGFVSTFGYIPLQATFGVNRQFLDFKYREDADPERREQADLILQVLDRPQSDFNEELWATEVGLSVQWRVARQVFIRPESRYYIPMDENEFNLNRFYLKIGVGIIL